MITFYPLVFLLVSASAFKADSFNKLDLDESKFNCYFNVTEAYEFSNGNKGTYEMSEDTTIEDLGSNGFKGTTEYSFMVEGTFGEPYGQSSQVSITSDFIVEESFIFFQQVGKGKFYIKDKEGKYREVGDVTATASGYQRILSDTEETMVTQTKQIIDFESFQTISESFSKMDVLVKADHSECSGIVTQTTKSGPYTSVIVTEVSETLPLPGKDGPITLTGEGMMQDPSGISSMKGSGTGYQSFSKESSDMKKWIAKQITLSLKNFKFGI